MAALTVWKFETPDGAEQALAKVEDLVKQQLITVQDAAWVTWPAGKKKPETHQAKSGVATGVAFGMFWGLLFGLIFLVPLFGLVWGAAVGAISGHFKRYGINDDFIKSVRDKVTEGTSALFLLSENATVDKVVEVFKGTKMELIQSNLSNEQEEKLKADFGEA